MHRTDTSERC